MELFKLWGEIGIKNSDAIKTLNETTSAAEQSSSKLSKIGSAVGKAGVAVGKATLAGMTACATGIGIITKSALESYADYEQLVGGVETLFKESADKVMEYANNAYQTAGMSANQYMETVTSFSASLLQSLGGDTAKASEYADMAITDMSDNANKMGTDMTMIQNAYQGFAKQNYTMLDNLKLGYGGTKEEMQRLLEDATALSGIEYDISSYADIVDAIHVVQTEMGITGTTAKEASSTIQGSMGMAKSAWQNLITGVADDKQDFDKLIQNFVDSAVTLLGNLLPRIKIIFDGIPKLITGLAPQIAPIVESILPALIESAVALMDGLVKALPDILKALTAVVPILIDGMATVVASLIEVLPEIINQIVLFLTDPSNIQMIIEASFTLFGAIVSVIPEIAINLLGAVPEIIKGLILGLVNSAPSLGEAVVKIFTAFFIDPFKELFGISSPSKLMEQQGGFITDGLINGIKSIPDKVFGIFNTMKEKILGVFNNLKTNVTTIWNNIKNAIENPIKTAKETVQNMINKIKSMFNFSWSLPKLKLPHFSISPSGWKLSDLLQGSIPKLGISWYAKGGILQNPTVFGFNGNLMAGGEAGDEAVAPIDTLLGYVRTAVAEQNFTLIRSLKESVSDIADKLSGKDEGDIVIPVYLGNNLIDDIIVNAKKNVKLRSGGLTNV